MASFKFFQIHRTSLSSHILPWRKPCSINTAQLKNYRSKFLVIWCNISRLMTRLRLMWNIAQGLSYYFTFSFIHNWVCVTHLINQYSLVTSGAILLIMALDSRYAYTHSHSQTCPYYWRMLTFQTTISDPSSRTMALGSTQPLTEMSTRNLPGGGGKGRPGLKGDNLTAIC
jgi:hypothetical protein